jgi:hypothetical protein
VTGWSAVTRAGVRRRRHRDRLVGAVWSKAGSAGKTGDGRAWVCSWAGGDGLVRLDGACAKAFVAGIDGARVGDIGGILRHGQLS